MIGTIGTAAPAFAFGISVAIFQAAATGTAELATDLGPWLPLRGSSFALRADPMTLPLALGFTAVATFIAFVALVDLPREGARRFYVVLNVLVAAGLVLLMARDLVLMLAAWSLVGACGAVLAGHSFRAADVARDGMVAFITGRAGDASLLVASLILFAVFQTLDIDQIVARLGQVALVASAERALMTASVLILLAAATRAGLAPLGAWLGDPLHIPRPVAAAIYALVMPSGLLLLLRLGDVLRLDALVLATALGAATAVLAATAALASYRVEAWRTVAVMGACVAALSAPPSALVTLLIAATLARSSGPLARRRRDGELVSGVGAALVVAVAGVLTIERPGIAAALFFAAALCAAAPARAARLGRTGIAAAELLRIALLSAVMVVVAVAANVIRLGGLREGTALGAVAILIGAAIGVSRIALPPRVGALAGAAVRLDGLPTLVERASSNAALLADRGGEAVIDRALRAVASLLASASRAVGGLAAGPAWAHQTLLIAATVALVAYWVAR